MASLFNKSLVLAAASKKQAKTFPVQLFESKSFNEAALDTGVYKFSFTHLEHHVMLSKRIVPNHRRNSGKVYWQR